MLPRQLTDRVARQWAIGHERGHFVLEHEAPPSAELCLPRAWCRGRQQYRSHLEAGRVTRSRSRLTALAAASPEVADVSAPVTEALTRLETRLTALESPLFAQRAAKRTRKRHAKARASRQLTIAPEIPALPAQDLLGAACA